MNTPELSTPNGFPVPEVVEPTTPKPDPLRRKGRQVRLLICVVLWSFISYLFISHFVLMAVEIKGASMSPTLIDGQRYLLYRCSYFLREPRKGEIVVIEDPQDLGLSIKRIVGLPGERVEMRTDGLYVNDVKANEPYLLSKYTLMPHNEPTKPVVLGKNAYFVLGDNRNVSADSRIYGPVRRNQILGLVSK